MFHLIGTILNIYLENRSLGGYTSYSQANISVEPPWGYSVPLTGYKYLMNKIIHLICFKKPQAAFNMGVVKSKFRDKSHHIRHEIKTLNITPNSCFIPGPNINFDEEDIAIRSCFCPVCQYIKEKPDRFIFYFFVHEYTKGYFICSIDVYQWKNSINIDIAE